MGLITAADLTFNGEEIKSVSEAVFESGFSKPEIAKFHNVITGIVTKKQIAILGRIGGLIGKGNGGCNPTPSDNKIINKEKFWNPVDISDRLEECWKDLKETFFVWGLKMGIEKADLTGTDFLNYVEEVLLDAMWEMIYRFVWFGDVDAANISDPAPGVITDTTDVAYFNKLNGFFKQIATIVGVNPERLTAGFATRNGAATYAAQKFTAQDTIDMVVTNTLETMITDSDLRLRGDDKTVFIVTQSVADQYVRELKKAVVSYSTERIEKGITMIEVDSVQVYVFSFLDRIIAEHMNDGTATYNPHRAVFVNPDNLQVGTGETNSFQELAIFYDPKTKTNVIDFAITLDAVLVEDHMVQAAY